MIIYYYFSRFSLNFESKCYISATSKHSGSSMSNYPYLVVVDELVQHDYHTSIPKWNGLSVHGALCVLYLFGVFFFINPHQYNSTIILFNEINLFR